jgi:predicted dehydrogenase
MPAKIHRRRFLETSAAGGAAALALSTRGLLAADSPNERVLVGVMGLSRGMAHAEGFANLSGVEVKYVCDVDKNRAGAAAKRIESSVGKAPEPITDFRRILDDKNVSALTCAAPNHWHAPAAILACKAGKHVYVEKPCSHNPREGELLVEAARKYNRAVQMGNQRRSSQSTQEAIAALHEGIIGRVYAARCYYNNRRASIGKGKEAPVPEHLDYELWQGPAPRKPYVDNRVHYNWHWFWHWGNGELGNNGVHSLDICRWGIQADFPIRTISSGGRYRFDDDQETPDTHVAAFEFEDKKQITWQGLSCNPHETNSGFCSFFGESGALELDGNGSYKVYDLNRNLVKEVKGSGVGELEHFANFVQAIRNDTPLKLNSEIAEGHKSTLLCHLGNIAYRANRTLQSDPKTGRIEGDEGAMKLWSRDYAPGWAPAV